MSELSKVLISNSLAAKAAIPANPEPVISNPKPVISKNSSFSRGVCQETHFAENDNEARIAALRRQKVEAARQARRDELLMMLADQPDVRYAVVTAADSDPVILAVAIRDLATFEMNIPLDRYDPFKLLQWIDDANAGPSQNQPIKSDR